MFCSQILFEILFEIEVGLNKKLSTEYCKKITNFPIIFYHKRSSEKIGIFDPQNRPIRTTSKTPTHHLYNLKFFEVY